MKIWVLTAIRDTEANGKEREKEIIMEEIKIQLDPQIQGSIWAGRKLSIQ